MSETADEPAGDSNQLEFVVPKREIFNIFDINKWYKSEVSQFSRITQKILINQGEF
jgi:hypothetical protein